MNKYVLLIVISFICCSQSYSQNANRFSINADSIRYLNSICGNFGDNLPVDTMYGPYPYIFFTTRQSRISLDGKYLASTLVVDWPFLLSGTVIVDIDKGKFVKYLDGARMPKWNPDGKRIVTAKYIYDVKMDSIFPFPKLPSNVSGFYIPEWSIDGQYIYYSTTGVTPAAGIYRSTRDGTDLIPIDFKYGALPYSQNELIYFASFFDDTVARGYEVYDLTTKQTSFTRVTSLDGVQGIYRQNLSYDQKFLVADIWYNRANLINQKQALCIFEIKTQRFKQILPAQAFGNAYYPSWTPWGTLIVSFACRLDSSYTTWEIDTNGVFIRQLTNKNMLDTQTSVHPETHIEKSFFVGEPYPNPVQKTSTIHYEIYSTTTVSIELMDLFGRVVKKYFLDQLLDPGSYTLSIVRNTDLNGMYFLRFKFGDRSTVTKKIILLR